MCSVLDHCSPDLTRAVITTRWHFSMLQALVDHAPAFLGVGCLGMPAYMRTSWPAVHLSASCARAGTQEQQRQLNANTRVSTEKWIKVECVYSGSLERSPK